MLFSGVPIGPGAVTFEEIEFVANRVGMEARIYTRTDFVRHRVELPAIVFFADRPPVALLSEKNRFEFLTVPQDGGRTSFSRKEVLEGQVTSIVGFSLTYTNAGEDARVGSASTIDRRHWLSGTMAPFWRSYIRVGLAACFINLIALASPLFTMNVYDRILPNKAVSSLWVLAIGVSISILFDLLLKTARASLIDYAGRKADLRISYLLFEKVLNSSLAAKPLSTGEYANRVSQYEFVREFFTSNTISVLIDTVFVFVFLFVIYLLAGWLVVIPSVAFVAGGDCRPCGAAPDRKTHRDCDERIIATTGPAGRVDLDPRDNQGASGGIVSAAQMARALQERSQDVGTDQATFGCRRQSDAVHPATGDGRCWSWPGPMRLPQAT